MHMSKLDNHVNFTTRILQKHTYRKKNPPEKKFPATILLTITCKWLNKYILNVTNNGTEEVLVRIFDNENVMIHEQAVEVTGSFGLIYNLNHVKSNTTSNVTFEVSTSSGKFERITF